MRFQLTMAAACLAALVYTAPATAETREEKRVADAADVLDQFLRIPEESIPPSLLARAYAVASGQCSRVRE